MACDTGDGWGIYELSASDFPSVAKQIKQNIRDLSNAERYILATQRHSVEAESDDFGDDYKLPCTSSDADVEVQSASGVSDASAAEQQDASSLVEDTVHKLPDVAVVTEVHQPFSEVHPASEAVENGSCTVIAMEVDGSISEEDNSETKKERDLIPQQEDGSGQVDSLIEQEPYAEDATPADPQHRYSEELRTRTLDMPVDPPADEQQATATKAVVSTEAVANHSEHNTADSASAIADERHGIVDGFIARVQDTLDIALDSIGANERYTSELLAVEEQIEQNIKDVEAFEAQRLVIEIEQNIKEAQRFIVETEHEEIDSSFERSEAAIIVNPEAKSDDSGNDSKFPTVESDAEAKLPPQRFTRSQSSASATREQHFLEGTVHRPPGGTVLAMVHRPAPETEENEPMDVDVDASTSDENGSETEAISSPKAVANPSEHDKIDVSTAKEDGSATAENNTEMPNFNPQQDGGPKDLVVVMGGPHVDAVIFANPLHQSNTEELGAKALDSPDIVVAPTPVPADQNMPETYSSPEIVEIPSEYDRAVNIVEKMDPAHLPRSADFQMLNDEVKEPTKLSDYANEGSDAKKDNCCLRCSIRCKCKGKACELGYKCTKKERKVLARGIVSVFQYWTDGFAPRWKLLMMAAKMFLYLILFVKMVVILVIDLNQEENKVFSIINFVISFCGIAVSFVYTVLFCILRRREFRITIRDLFCFAIPEFCTCIGLFFYKCCCCCCTIECLKKEKEKKTEENKEKDKHRKAEEYVNGMQKFKPAQNSFEKFTALVGNTSEVLLTIVDDVILTVVFILSLYSFIGKQRFTIFYGSVSVGSVFSFLGLVVSALYLFIFVHGLRIISIAYNVGALDTKVERDSKVMELKLPNKFIRYCFSFQSRLVFHVVASSAFQLYSIFALSWKIIQDSCSAVVAPSIPMGYGTNGSYTSLISPGAPFTCNLHPMVNGFTIYNILYIAIAPTFLGYTSFFVCNTPWLVEYLQTIEMWTYFNKACTAGYRVRTGKKNKVTGCCVRLKNCWQDVVGQDGGGQDIVGKAAEDSELCNVSDKDAYMSPKLQLIRLFGGDLLCNVTPDELREHGANAERVCQAIQEDLNRNAVKLGTNFVSRAVMMLGQAMFFLPAAIIGVLQVILFIIHLSFMGCCVNGDVHTVLSPSVLTDAAVVLVPPMFLFLLTSAPGPWMGLFWISVVIGIIATVAALVASVVAIVALVLLLCVLAVCLGSSSSRRNQY